MKGESAKEYLWGDPSLDCEGYVHSVETCGTVDGPGLRFVLFTTGCPLRCLYCHNPDTQILSSGKLTTAGEIVKQVVRYKGFIKNGGMTISGGEPLSQQRFIESIFREMKQLGIHTALDTSGCFGTNIRPGLLNHVDLVLLDLKSWGNEAHKKITGQSMQATLKFAEHLKEIKQPTWIRFVLVPGLTDNEETINGIGEFVKTLPNVELVEVLPFHKYGEPKYNELNRKYKLSETEEPSEEAVEEVRNQFESFGLKVR